MNKCYDEYCNTEGAEQFGICSHNSFSFMVSWFTPNGMRLETTKNSYLVVFDEQSNRCGSRYYTRFNSLHTFPPKWVRYNQIEKENKNYGKKENGNKNSRTDNSTGYDA